MNLQITTPSRQCIFNCPYCIAKQHTHGNDFVNLYENNRFSWAIKLSHELMTGIYDCVVVTGTNEPTQDEQYIKDVIDIVEWVNYETELHIKTELQTKCYTPKDYFSRFDVIAISFDNTKILQKIYRDYLRCKFNKTLRFVLLYTDMVDLIELKDFYDNINISNSLGIISGMKLQLTIKMLQQGEVDNDYSKWVKEHSGTMENFGKINNLCQEQHNDYCLVSYRFDSNCMESETRYRVFREDGEIYKDWSSKEPIKKKEGEK